mmetsp:Transcript_52535/g.67357  ORF Transcript_52535/g.67357 Transcript_52535/m.67357 type:complete len:126 (+) Transcript_52535:71-448(+)
MATVSCTPAGTPFCPTCGSILQLPDHNPIQCNMCSFTTTYEQVHLPVVTTQSTSRPTPGWAILDEQKEADAKTKDGPARMTSQERCPKCDHPELNYYTMQLRSADEGQTVFYECPSCNYTFSVNN